MRIRVSKEKARSSAKLVEEGNLIALRTVAGARALCMPRKQLGCVAQVMEWGIHLAYYMLGSSGFNTENRTASATGG